MSPVYLPCRFRVKTPGNSNPDSSGQSSDLALCALREFPDGVGTETRSQWAGKVMRIFDEEESHDRIRGWDFVAGLDGSLESRAIVRVENGDDNNEDEVQYPARYQIPSSALEGLDPKHKVRKAELFAMASLLYEIMSGTEPFKGLSDEEVQRRFSQGEFPKDASSLPSSLVIYSGWSEEFSLALAKQGRSFRIPNSFRSFILCTPFHSPGQPEPERQPTDPPLPTVETEKPTMLQSVTAYAKAHPIRTGLQVAGLTLSAVSFLAVPILGAVGFTAAGPAAGSAAAAWQSSIGLVRAGSLFSWCQGVAMGGSALGTVQAAGLAGAALARVADAPQYMKLLEQVLPNANRGHRTASERQLL